MRQVTLFVYSVYYCLCQLSTQQYAVKFSDDTAILTELLWTGLWTGVMFTDCILIQVKLLRGCKTPDQLETGALWLYMVMVIYGSILITIYAAHTVVYGVVPPPGLGIKQSNLKFRSSCLVKTAGKIIGIPAPLTPPNLFEQPSGRSIAFYLTLLMNCILIHSFIPISV